MQSQPVGQRYATVFALIVFFLLFFLFFFFFQRHEQQAYLPNGNATATADGLSLKVSGDGHFRTSGTINGEPVVFMLDTGASGVALSEGRARGRAGQHRQRGDGRAVGAAGFARFWWLGICRCARVHHAAHG